MQIKSTTLIALGTVWLGSLAGAYQFGKKEVLPNAMDTPQRRQASSGHSSPLNPAVGEKKTAATGGFSSATAENGAYMELKPLLAKLKGMLRTGGSMQNPNTMMKVMGLLDKLRPEDYQAALAEAEASTDPQTKMMLQMAVLGKWAATNGPEAMKYAEEHSSGLGMMAQMAKVSVTAAWAENDPEAVWKWYEANKDANKGPMGSGMTLVSLFSSLANKDPEAAFKRLSQLDHQDKQMALAGMFQASLFEAEKRDAILKQVDAMPDESDRKTAKQSMLSQWMMLAPDEAMQYMKTLPAAEQGTLRESTGQMLMMSNPKKGAEFIMEGVTEADRGKRTASVVTSWAYTDPNAAGTWLKEQPQGAHLDEAKRGFIYAAAEKDPGSAMVWATTITDENIREAATNHAYDKWKKSDPALAEEALRKSGIKEEAITRILTKTPETK